MLNYMIDQDGLMPKRGKGGNDGRDLDWAD